MSNVGDRADNSAGAHHEGVATATGPTAAAGRDSGCQGDEPAVGVETLDL